MPGYSGTPLPKKLGIKPGARVYLPNAAPDVLAELRITLAGCENASNGKAPLDFAMVFTKSKAELARDFKRISKLLAPAGMLWVSWPKKSSGVVTDLNENIARGWTRCRIGGREGMRGDGGLVGIEICATR